MSGGQPIDLVLVAMPFADVHTPSISLGLLQALLERGGLRVRSEYANLLYADRLGALASAQVFAGRGCHVGDWLFCSAIFPGRIAEPREIAAVVLGRRAAHDPDRLARLEDDLRDWRGATAQFLDDVAERIVAEGAPLVGCSATFLQLYPALALLKRIHERAPGVVTLIGGPGCETGMGLAVHRLFPWVDYLVSGEADDIVVPLVLRLLREGRECEPAALPAGVRGPRQRLAPHAADPPAEAFLARARDMGGHPTPQYADYFATLAELPRLQCAVSPALPIEGSRGCWRAVRSPCFFCGDNGARAEFRPRPAADFLRDLDELHRRHGLKRFVATDNMMDPGYVQGVFRELARREAPYQLFFEISACLERDAVATLSSGGMTWMQPGIESLSTEILRVANKGHEAWQNVQLLKWCRQYGIRVTWNMLFGFPQELDEWHAAAAALVPALSHLNPPRFFHPVMACRNSVYFGRAAELGVSVTPSPAYARFLPLPPESVAELAFTFESVRAASARGPRDGAEALAAGVLVWQQRFRRQPKPGLVMVDDGESLTILDTRDREEHIALFGVERLALLLADEAPPREELLAELAREHPAREIEEALEGLLRRRLVIALDGRIIGLVLKPPLPELAGDEEIPSGYLDRQKWRASDAPPSPSSPGRS